MKTFIIAEIGINHNGDLSIAKQLIDVAKHAECDAVKFQKRTVDVVYSPEELARPRDNPFGPTNGDLKRGLEFGLDEYTEIDNYCRKKGIIWSASCWDIEAFEFINQFDVVFHKVASACLTDLDLLDRINGTDVPVLLSTGGSEIQQIETALSRLESCSYLTLLHTCSAYPSPYDELNLLAIPAMRRKFGLPVGYSGHESGIVTSVAAVALGACAIERHITLGRAMWGSDQAASLGPRGLEQLVRDIRLVEISLGDGVKRTMPSEVSVMKKLRRFL